MIFAAALLAPLALLLPEAEGVGHLISASGPVADAVQKPEFAEKRAPAAGMGDYSAWQDSLDGLEDQRQNQVQIEQRMTIRIAPRAAPRVNILSMLPDGETEPRMVEKKMAKCVPASGIAGVQVNGPSNLILFMRDRRMVNAALERSCRARDFYSGFYLQRSTDGKLCVDRDTLLSRSGANCKLTRFRELVADDD